MAKGFIFNDWATDAACLTQAQQVMAAKDEGRYKPFHCGFILQYKPNFLRRFFLLRFHPFSR